MNTTKQVAHLGFAVALLVGMVAGGRQASAQEDAGKAPAMSRPLAAAAAASPNAVIGLNHSLQRNYLSSGTLSGAFLPGFTYEPVDNQQVVTCPGTSGTCTIQADHWIELEGFTAGNAAWGCLAVDGVLDPNCGFIEDKIPPDGSWLQVTSSHFMSGISAGPHIVQTFINSSNGAYAAYYNVNYRVFKP